MTRDARSAPDWRPSASLEMLRLRARLLERARAFFQRRGVLEVETPILSEAAATDPQLESFRTGYRGPGAAHGRELFLHTSPEFAMKRLLAAGSGPIYQIARVFRQGEAGRLHNPEFTMLEWYRPGLGMHALMDEVEELVGDLLEGLHPPAAAVRMTYRDAFLKYAALDPFTAGSEELHACAAAHGVAGDFDAEPRDAWLDLLLTHVVEPGLAEQPLAFLIDYPPSQAALARIRAPERAGEFEVAERFELYCRGVELANGFNELLDAREQALRFERDRLTRRRTGLPELPRDERLLAALEAGLPACAGVALGLDRLLMLAVGAKSLDAVLAFPIERA